MYKKASQAVQAKTTPETASLAVSLSLSNSPAYAGQLPNPKPENLHALNPNCCFYKLGLLCCLCPFSKIPIPFGVCVRAPGFGNSQIPKLTTPPAPNKLSACSASKQPHPPKEQLIGLGQNGLDIRLADFRRGRMEASQVTCRDAPNRTSLCSGIHLTTFGTVWCAALRSYQELRKPAVLGAWGHPMSQGVYYMAWCVNGFLGE